MSNDPFVVPPTTGGRAYTGFIADIRDDTPPQAGDDVLVEYNNLTVITLCVEGDSLNQAAPEGSLIIIGYSVKTLRDGEMGVFRRDGEAAFKRCKGDDSGAWLEPDSSNRRHGKMFPTDDEPIEVVGRVIDIRPEYYSTLFASGPKRRAGYRGQGKSTVEIIEKLRERRGGGRVALPNYYFCWPRIPTRR